MRFKLATTLAAGALAAGALLGTAAPAFAAPADYQAAGCSSTRLPGAKVYCTPDAPKVTPPPTVTPEPDHNPDDPQGMECTPKYSHGDKGCPQQP